MHTRPHTRMYMGCWASKLPGMCPPLIPALNPRVQGAQAKGAAGQPASLEVIKAWAGAGAGEQGGVFCLTSRDATELRTWVPPETYMEFTNPGVQTWWGGWPGVWLVCLQGA